MKKIIVNKKTAPLTIIIVLLIAYFFVFTAKYQIQLYTLRQQKKELVTQINEEKEKQLIYQEELAKIGTDEYYEYLARKYLGYIYPDEKVMIWLEQDKK